MNIAAPTYQPSIDGLRAVAVLAVVIFHAFPQSLPGGFAGVDVFFVISGYLITGILLGREGCSLGDFYTRRIKRIFPALLVVLAACLGFGFVALLPEEFGHLGKHAAGGAGFVANLTLWHEAGYFDGSAESKPLLHLWSLGVEEQFYIVWPLLVWVLRRRAQLLVGAMAVLALASFAYNVTHVANDPVAAFYSPLSRFWELAVGGLIAGWHASSPREYALPPIAPLAGAAAIAAGFQMLDKTGAFPGYAALLPVAGTALLLASGPGATLNRSLLSLPPMVWLGRISYPLYLWHWPLLAFAFILQAGKPAQSIRLAAVAAAILLAWLTTRFIEGPLRFRKAAAVPVTLAVLMVLTGGAGYGLYAAHGLPERQIANLGKYLPAAEGAAVRGPTAPAATATHAQAAMAPDSPAPATVADMLADSAESDAAMARLRAARRAEYHFIGRLQSERNRAERYSTCHLYDLPDTPASFDQYRAGNVGCIMLDASRKNVLVFGDSAAAEFHLALSRAYPEVNFIQITGSACRPFHAAYGDGFHLCVKLLEYAQDFVAHNKLEGVVVASQWRDDFAAALPDLKRFAASGAPVLLVGPPLVFSDNVPTAMLRMEPSQSLAATVGAMLEPSYLNYADAMHTFAQRNGFSYVNRVSLYCQGGCPLIAPGGEPMVLDNFHLSLPGIDLLSKRLRDADALAPLLRQPANG